MKKLLTALLISFSLIFTASSALSTVGTKEEATETPSITRQLKPEEAIGEGLVKEGQKVKVCFLLNETEQECFVFTSNEDQIIYILGEVNGKEYNLPPGKYKVAYGHGFYVSCPKHGRERVKGPYPTILFIKVEDLKDYKAL